MSKSLFIIFSFPTRRILLSLLLLFLFVSKSLAQSNLNELEIYFATDTIMVAQGKTFSNFLLVKNLTNSKITVNSLGAIEKYPGLLLVSKVPLEIQPNSKEKMFVKFIASTDFMKLSSDALTFEVSYNLPNSEQNSKQATFYKKTNEQEDVFVYPLLRENFIDPLLPESTISLVVENTGYSRRSLQLEFESNSTAVQVVQKNTTVNLEGKEKQFIEMKFAIRQQRTYSPNYNIQVKAFDAISNKAVNITNVQLIILSNSTQVMRNSQIATDKNYAELGYNKSSNGFDYMQLQANAEANIGINTRATFNTAIDYYNNSDALSIYSTFLDIEHKGSTLRVGNIYGNDYDFSLSGRGARVFTNVGVNKNIEVVAIDNNYNLYSNYIAESKSSKTVAAKYLFGDPSNYHGKISYLFDHNPLQFTDSQVSHYSSAFKIATNHSFRVEGAASFERSYLYDKGKGGIMSSVNYDYRNDRWDINSINTFASSNYAGMNRGTFNVYQNIGYKLMDKSRLFFQYQNTQSNPEYIYNRYFDSNLPQFSFDPYTFHSSHLVKSGLQRSFNQWNITISPSIEKQKNITNYNNADLISYRLGTAVSTSIKSHSINLSAEYSYSEAEQKLLYFSSFKTMMSYRFKNFSLNGTVQYNPNTIYDLNYFTATSGNFINYSVYSSYNFKTYQNKISGYISAGYNHSELYKNLNQNINAALEYRIAQSWAGTAYLNYSNYESLLARSFSGDNYQFRIGIKKYLADAISNEFSTVTLQFYQDKNLNGIFDEDELAMPNEIIKLDNYIAKTDKYGKVRFRNVPQGVYTLRVTESTGVRLLQNPSIVVTRNINSQIGLGRNNKVTGKLIEIKQAYDDLVSDVRGIIVYAEDEQGQKTYTAIDQNDEFEFFLKNGSYKIFIENNLYEYVQPSQHIELNNADYTEPLIFSYMKKDRKIKVKKF